MTKELELKLQEKYPEIFKNLYGPADQTCLHFGIEHGDGWYDLIDRLCHSLQWNADKNGYMQVICDQCKEKFGELRFYYHFEETEKSITAKDNEWKRGNEYLEGMIHFAEIMSGSICERCGKPGTLNSRGWIQCLCEDCKTK